MMDSDRDLGGAVENPVEDGPPIARGMTAVSRRRQTLQAILVLGGLLDTARRRVDRRVVWHEAFRDDQGRNVKVYVRVEVER